MGQNGDPRAAQGGASGVSEVRLGIDTAEDAGLDQRVGYRGDLGAAHRPRAVVVLATEHDAAGRSFGPVVVDRDQRIVEEGRQAAPVAEKVADRLGKGAARQRRLLLGPCLELRGDGPRVGVAAMAAKLERLAIPSPSSVDGS